MSRFPSAGSFEAVLLDVDGTLVDSTHANVESWATVLKEFGCDATREQLRQQMGKGGDELMPVFLSPAACARDGEAIEARRQEIFDTVHRKRLQPLPGSREFVRRLLDDGYRVILASSAGGETLEFYKKLARIDDLISESTSSDAVERSKPQPDIFQSALAQLDGTSRDRVLVIGDSPYDAQAARRAGLRCLGVLSGGFSEQQLRDAGCLAIYRDIFDLYERYDDSILRRHGDPASPSIA